MGRVPVRVVDPVLALMVAVPTCLDAWWNGADTRQADAFTYLLVLAPAGLLLLRRRWPVLVAVLCAAALAGWHIVGHRGELTGLALMVALYTVAVQGDRRRSLVAAGAVAVLLAVVAVVVGDAGLPVTEIGLPVAALLLGETVRGRRELLAEQAVRAEREQVVREAEFQGRAQQERLHIARELHDVIAHTVTAINVQAGVAAEALDRNPALTRTALAQVRELGRGASAELRTTVGLLRDGWSAVPTDPAPGLGEMAALVAGIRSTGLRVELHENGSAPVSAGVELAAYRIVQESLTNVIRHAAARHAQVRICRGDPYLTVEVTDDGAGDAGGAGFGLRGIVERAASVGGTAGWGSRPAGGFRVYAQLPTIGAFGEEPR